MDLNDLRTLFTMLAFGLFIGIVIWAYSAKQKSSFDAAARLVVDDEDNPPGGRGAGQAQH